MRKFKKAIKGFLFISFVLVMTNCATEEISQQNGVQSSTEAKIWFDIHKDNYNTTILKYVKDLQWENAIVSDGDIGQVVEVPFTLQGNLSTSNKNADLYNDHHRLMFIKDEQNKFKLFDVQIFTADKKSKILDKNYNYYSIKDDFDGKVFVQELATNIGSKLEFKNGNKIIPSLTSKQREAYIDCVAIGYWYEDGHFEPIGILYCEGGGDSGEPSPSGGYGGGGGISGSGSGSGTTGVTNAQKIEKQITSDKLDPCSKEVLTKLKSLSQSDIANVISKFDSNASIFTINVKTGVVTNPNNDAETVPVSSFNYNITLSENYTNGVLEGELNSPPTTLSLATTLTHEILHAYLLSVVDEYKLLGSSTIYDFPTIYDAYVTHKVPKGGSQAQVDAQHDLIAKQFVNTIACTIQEFQTGSAVTSGFPNQVYQDIAWAGLEGTSIFNKNYPNDPSNKNYNDRNRILSRGSIEKYNKPRGNQVPVGKPCK